MGLRKEGSFVLTTLHLELDDKQLRVILSLIGNQIEDLDLKISKGIKDSQCSYEEIAEVTRMRNGLSCLRDILNRKMNEHR